MGVFYGVCVWGWVCFVRLFLFFVVVVFVVVVVVVVLIRNDTFVQYQKRIDSEMLETVAQQRLVARGAQPNFFPVRIVTPPPVTPSKLIRFDPFVNCIVVILVKFIEFVFRKNSIYLFPSSFLSLFIHFFFYFPLFFFSFSLPFSFFLPFFPFPLLFLFSLPLVFPGR